MRADAKRLDAGYLFHMVWNQRFRFLGEKAMQGAAGQKRVSTEFLKKFEIPVPPMMEQKRIAVILDKADAIRRKRQQAIELADQFLNSVFMDMFGDPVTNPKGWDKSTIENLSERVTKGESPKWQGFEYQVDGVRFVTSENVLWGKLDKRRKYIPEEFHRKLSRSALRSNDLLINLVGASVGRACLVSDDGLPANINQAVSVTTFDQSRIIPEIALRQILNSGMQRELLGNVVDAARANISLKNIRELVLIVPPRPVQERYFAIAAKTKRLFDLQNSNLSLPLLESLIQKAFSGEL